MEGMKEAESFEAWRDKYVRKGDGEKFREAYNRIHGIVRRRRKRDEETTER